MRFKITTVLFSMAMLIAAACSRDNTLNVPGKANKDGNMMSALTLTNGGKFNISQCPTKDELPKIGYIHDLQNYPDGKPGALLILGNNRLNIWIDGEAHPETYADPGSVMKDGSPNMVTMMYRATCDNKSIEAKFFQGKHFGTWSIQKVEGGYKFINTYDGAELANKFYPQK